MQYILYFCRLFRFMRRISAILMFVLLCWATAFPQKKSDFRMWEDSLCNLRDRVMAESDETARLALNEDFMSLLEEILQMPDAFKFTWDSVKNFSVLASPDNVFKIFTWYVVKNNYDIENLDLYKSIMTLVRNTSSTRCTTSGRTSTIRKR